MEPEWNNSPENDDASMLGLRPREFLSQIYFSLGQDLDCGKVCSEIARYIANHNQRHGTNTDRVLVISIKDTTLDPNIPKLEHLDGA